MLVLTRKLNEQIKIGRDITITIVRLKGNVVRVGIDAPKNVRIARSELLAKLPAGSVEDPAQQVEPGTSSPRAAGAAGDAWPASSSHSEGCSDRPQETQPLAVGPRSVSLAVRGAGPRQAPLSGMVRRKQAVM